MSWLQNLLGGSKARVSGEPPSGNGASSFHLWWELGRGRPLQEVSAILEIVEPPRVDRLYFWAMQVSFADPDGGGAHIGIQHHPRYPASGAVNWGGYAPQPEGGLLQGSPSPLPSAPNDPNTRDFAWSAHRPYRLSIGRSPEPGPEGFVAWRGSVEDLTTGEVTVVRDLYSRGTYLRGPVVWTECFARCDHPTTAVRWSGLQVVDDVDEPSVVTAVSVNYQTHANGGCDNTNSSVDGDGWLQRANTSRTNPTGTRLTP